MRQQMINVIAAASACVLGVALLAIPANTALASNWASAVDNCQGALPSFEGAFRKRPLGINNEGASSAFVSCAIRADFDDDLVGVGVLFTNRGAGAATINCTLVSGVALPAPFAPPVMIPKSVSIAANDFAVMSWSTGDNGGEPFALPNLSCSIPPGAEINVIQLNTTVPTPE